MFHMKGMKNMKRICLCTCSIVLCLLCLCCHATADASADVRFSPLLETWDATNGDELWQHVWTYFQQRHPDDERTPSNLNICIGWTTEELLRSADAWDVAIVSSRDVDLQRLADASLLKKRAHVPSQSLAISQWLYPEAIQALLPTDPIWIFYVYCYDYDPQTGDATLLLCHTDNIYDVKDSALCAETIMDARSAEQIRQTEQILRAGWSSWTVDKLLAQPEAWDVATIAIQDENELAVLNQAGLLWDFSQDAYWTDRCKEWDVPNGYYNADGSMIAIPYAQYASLRPNDTLVLVINRQSSVLDRAEAYAKHWMKSYEWMYDRATLQDTPAEHKKMYGISLYKDEMDW